MAMNFFLLCNLCDWLSIDNRGRSESIEEEEEEATAAATSVTHNRRG